MRLPSVPYSSARLPAGLFCYRARGAESFAREPSKISISIPALQARSSARSTSLNSAATPEGKPANAGFIERFLKLGLDFFLELWYNGGTMGERGDDARASRGFD